MSCASCSYCMYCGCYRVHGCIAERICMYVHCVCIVHVVRMVCLRTFHMCRSGVMCTVVDVPACNAHVRIRICLYGLVVTLCSYALWVLFGVIILFIIDMVCMACMLVVVSLYVICYLFIYIIFWLWNYFIPFIM